MHGEQFINPNLHVILVHYPIALLFVGTLIEVFSFLGWRRSGFHTAGRWMIFLGVLSSIPTALAGLYALNDVVRMSLPASMHHAHWADALAASALVNDGKTWAMLQLHAWLNACVSAALTLGVVFWAGGSDTFRRFMYIPVLLLVVLGLAATGAGAWYGGEMVYRRGVGVSDHPRLTVSEAVVAHEHGAGASTASTAVATTLPTTSPASDLKQKINYYLPPLQTHMIFAGFTIAMAMGALAASFRRANVLNDDIRNYPPRRDGATDYAAAFGARPQAYPIDPNPRPGFPPPPIPFGDELVDSVGGGRFWLLAFVLALITALGGAWVFLNATGLPLADVVKDLPTIWKDSILAFPRRLLHVLTGTSIVVLPLICAMIARWVPRQRWAMFLVALWVLAAVALQVWLGTLLLWDGVEGPWNAFHLPAP